jgi:hypothetical protein
MLPIGTSRAVEGHKEKVELRVLKDLQDLQAIVGI